MAAISKSREFPHICRFTVLVVYLSIEICLQSSMPIGKMGASIAQGVGLIVLIVFELVRKRRYSGAECVVLLTIGMLGIQLLSQGAGSALFCICVIAFIFRDYKVEAIAKCMFFTIMAWAVLMPILTQLGIVADVVTVETIDRASRVSYGFAWPSRLPTYILIALCCYFIWRRKSSSLLVVLALCAYAGFIYMGSDAKYPFFLTLCVAIVGVAIKRCRTNILRGNEAMMTFVMVLFALFPLLSIVLSVAFDPSSSFFSRLDGVLSHRLLVSAIGIDARGLSLFGSVESLHQTAKDAYAFGYFDCGYLNMLYSFGVVPFVILLAALLLALGVCVRNGLEFEVLAFLAFGLFSMFYSHMIFSPSYCLVAFIAVKALVAPDRILWAAYGSDDDIRRAQVRLAHR